LEAICFNYISKVRFWQVVCLDLLFFKFLSKIKEIMALEIKQNLNKEQWDSFLSQFSEFNPFEQSFAWGDILLTEGKEVEKLALFEGNEHVAVALVVYEKLPFGFKYAFSPKGPVIKMTNDQPCLPAGRFPMTNVVDVISQYLKDKKCVFWRIEPNIIQKSEFKNHKLVQVKDVNPSNTLILKLDKSYEEILSAMHSKTRYNIGLSKKKDLRVEEKKDLEIFWDLMKRTGERDAFRLHEKKHYEKVLNSEMVSQVIIYFENKPIATGVFVRFGQTFTYLYGASDHEYRSLMAPYLVQDFGLNKAKKEGCANYDFFGIAPVVKGTDDEWVYDEKHQYAGVTRFKLGFGGEYFKAPGTFEIPLKYRVYKIIKACLPVGRFIKFLRMLLKK